jgi:predicted nucleotide-binding protein
VGTSPGQQEASNNARDATGDLIARSPSKGERKDTREDPSKRVFLVHGRDEKNTRILKEMLIQWGLVPKIMIEEPHMGRTLIEKLIDLGSGVGYVFVLMTPDDVGIGARELTELQKGFECGTGHHPANAKELASFLRGRARQNVIFEYGMFMGQLGRKKVCLLKKGDVDFPTDLLGLGYIPFKEEVSEQDCSEQIERELRRAGYELKSQKVIWDVSSSSSSQVGVRGREVLDEDLPPEIRSELERLRKSPYTISNVRVFRDTDGTYTIQYDEI